MARTRKNATRRRRPRKGSAPRPPGRPVARSGRPRPRSGAVRLPILGALLVSLVVAVVSATVPELRLALGDGGIPGTATVLSCEPLGRGRYDCSARFVFDDPSREPIVVGTVPDATVGEAFPAVLIPGEERVVPTGARGVWRQVPVLAALPLAAALIAFLTALVLRSRKAIVWTGAVTLPLLVLVVAGLVLGA